MTTTRNSIPMIVTADSRLAWEDARIAEHMANGADRDEALRLTMIEWRDMTGEDED